MINDSSNSCFDVKKLIDLDPFIDPETLEPLTDEYGEPFYDFVPDAELVYVVEFKTKGQKTVLYFQTDDNEISICLKRCTLTGPELVRDVLLKSLCFVLDLYNIGKFVDKLCDININLENKCITALIPASIWAKRRLNTHE